MRKLTSIALFAVLLSACSSSVDYSQVYANESSYEIQLISKYGKPNDDSIYFDTTGLASGEEHLEYIFTFAENLNNIEECGKSPLFFDIIVKDNDALHVDLNLTDTDNWEFIVLRDKKYGKSAAECRLVVSDQVIN